MDEDIEVEPDESELKEDVVADTEKEAKALIEFLGLEWNDKCLAFHKSDRPVKTASVAQVRRPIYNTAVKRWMKYGDGLQPLVDRYHPARKELPKLAANRRAFGQATIRHAVFGIVLGILTPNRG